MSWIEISNKEAIGIELTAYPPSSEDTAAPTPPDRRKQSVHGQPALSRM
jgi:hypothetical protein